MKVVGFIFVVLSVAVVVNGNPVCPNPMLSCGCYNAPVCATNGTTYLYFINTCYLEAENCVRTTTNRPCFQKVSYTFCENININDPPVCLAVVDPVCAVNYYGVKRTFSNACQVSVANYNEGNIWTIIRPGDC